MHGELSQVAVAPPGDAVMRNGDPPVAVNDTTAFLLPATAVTPVGAPGEADCGVTGSAAADAGESPRALVARTVNVYAVPLARPGMVHGLL